MRIIKDADFRKEIKTAPASGYLFFGDEDYLKAFCLQAARDAICPDPSFAFFNEMKLDAMDFTPQKLLDALMPMPMMADRKLITLSGLNFTTMKANELEDLCEILATLTDYDYNVLIINVSADCFDPGRLPKKPSAALSALSEYLTPVQFDRSTPAKLSAWAQKHFAHNGVEASTQFCSKMIEYCGHSMFALANEIDKLSFYLRAHNQTVPTEDAMKTVCIAANEYDTFDFTNAIMAGQKTRALDILADYRFRRVDPIIILGEVIHVVCDMIQVRTLIQEGVPVPQISATFKIHEFRIGLYQNSLRKLTGERLRETLDACLAADSALKNSPKGYTILEKLICSI